MRRKATSAACHGVPGRPAFSHALLCGPAPPGRASRDVRCRGWVAGGALVEVFGPGGAPLGREVPGGVQLSSIRNRRRALLASAPGALPSAGAGARRAGQAASGGAGVAGLPAGGAALHRHGAWPGAGTGAGSWDGALLGGRAHSYGVAAVGGAAAAGAAPGPGTAAALGGPAHSYAALVGAAAASTAAATSAAEFPAMAPAASGSHGGGRSGQAAPAPAGAAAAQAGVAAMHARGGGAALADACAEGAWPLALAPGQNQFTIMVTAPDAAAQVAPPLQG